MLGLQTAMGIATQTNNAAPEVQEKTLSIMDMIIGGGTLHLFRTHICYQSSFASR